MKLETLLIHSGADVDTETGAVAPPIHLSTTYEHAPDGELIHGFEYVREANPTQTRLETALAAIEGGAAAYVFASGLAAGAGYLQTLPAGSHVVAPDDVYHGFRDIFLELGADAVLHSTTKYMGGHSDVQGGAVILAEREPLGPELWNVRTTLGGVASPWNAWLVLRGLRSLSCRVERHASNALAVAEALAEHPAVGPVHYPGLADHPGHEIARRQMRAFGGVVSFELRGGHEAALAVASELRLFTNATSLGGVESLVEHRASIEGPHSSTSPSLLRLSVGLEHPDDLVADLQKALDTIPTGVR